MERIGKESAPTIRAAVLRLESQASLPAALCALERLQSLDPELFGAALAGDSGGIVLTAWQILAERATTAEHKTTFPTRDDTLRIFGEKVYESQPAIARVAADGLARHPSSLNLLPLMMKWDAPQGDLALADAVRMALRDNLRHPGIYAEVGKRLVGDDETVGGSSFRDPGFHKEDLARLSEVSLAVPTVDSATFLLAQRQRTGLQDARSAEFLRHATLHLPEDQFPAVFALVEKADAPFLPQRLALPPADFQDLIGYLLSPPPAAQ